MSRNLRMTSACIVLALGAVALPVFAAEGRIPVWEPVALGPGSQPGQYFVTRDVTGAGGPAISLFGGPGFEEAEIDLNGFTLFGDPGAGGAVIEAFGLRSLTIRNGSLNHVAGGGDIIKITDVEKVVIEDVKTQGGDFGIFLESVQNFALRRNVIVAPGATGILIDSAGSPVPIEGVVEDNLVKDTGADGIALFGLHASSTLQENHVLRAADFGISVLGGSSYIVAENTVQATGSDGIHLEAGNASKVYNNVVERAGGAGIAMLALGGFLVLDNVSSGNIGDGILVDAFLNHIDRNVTQFNGGCGLHLGPGSADNTYGRNSARGNGGCPCAFIPAVEVCPAPYGGGSFPPNFCNEAPPAAGNTSFCDNLLPGPPRS